MIRTLVALVFLLALPALTRAASVEDDVKAIREDLRVRNVSGPYIAKNAEKRLKEWSAAAEKGDPAGQWLLGRCHHQGVGGLKADIAEGAKWIRKAAEQGFGLAENNLGLLYEDGDGVDKDLDEAVRWLKKGAERGEFVAQYNLARVYRDAKKDVAEAIKWYAKAGEQKHFASLAELARMYERGKGVDVDEKEALKWHRAGSEAGNAMATARALALVEEGKTLKPAEGESRKLLETLRKQTGDDADELLLLAAIQRGDPVGRAAPNARGTIDGKAFKLSDQRGKVVVLKFGATWCGPCKAMLPQQKDMLKRLKDEPFTILDVDIDDNEALAERWDITSVPAIYVIDAKGVIRYKDVRGEDLDKAVDKLLAAMKEKKD